MNFILILSVINTPNKRLSYTNIRSIYSSNERYDQLKNTIVSLQKIPNKKVLLIECSNIESEKEDFLKTNVDFYLNLINIIDVNEYIYSESKSLGEGYMTIKAIDFIMEHKLTFDYLYKISGRYILSDTFDYNYYNNDHNIFKQINNNKNNICTVLYKLQYDQLEILHNFLINNIETMKKNIGYEIIIGKFVNNINDVMFVDKLYVEGFVAVCGSYYVG